MRSEPPEVVLRSMSMRWGAATHAGNVRVLNEDAVLAKPGLCVVADGMGGHRAGDVASQLAVSTFDAEIVTTPISVDRLRDVVARANENILSQSVQHDRRRMGTTCVGVVVAHNGGRESIIAFNVGDSRCYQMVDETLQRITTDHSEVQELIDAGAITPRQARSHSRRNVITRALGIDVLAVADFVVVDEHEEQRLLLCSDGLTAELEDEAILEVLTGHANPQDAADALIAAALQGCAADNISAVVVDVRRPPSEGDASGPSIGGVNDVDTEPRPPTGPSDLTEQVPRVDGVGSVASTGRLPEFAPGSSTTEQKEEHPADAFIGRIFSSPDDAPGEDVLP